MENDFWKNPKNLFDVDNEAKPSPDQAPQKPKTPPYKFNMGKDKDRNELWQLLKIKALVDSPNALSKSEGSNNMNNSNVLSDEKGNFLGVKHSVVKGVHATVKNQTALLKALRQDAYNRHGIKE